jgi:hypothetical protein
MAICGAHDQDTGATCTKQQHSEDESHWDFRQERAWIEVVVPPTRIRLELEIENHYDGDVVTTHKTVTVTMPPEDQDSDEYDDWLNDGPIFEATGTGRTEGNSAYFVKVLSSTYKKAIPVGTEYEFGL